MVALESRCVELYLRRNEASLVEAMNGHVPFGGCVMRLNRCQGVTATCRLLGELHEGTSASPNTLCGAVVAVEPRWVELYYLEKKRSHIAAGAAKGQVAFGC